MAGPEDFQQGTLDDVFPETAPENPAEVPRDYFDGYALDDLTMMSRDQFGLVPEGTLHRHSYLYMAEFPVSGGGPDESPTGAIELRARTWNYQQEQNLSGALKATVKSIAHKAATVFNTTTETAAYAGYLDGFFTGIQPITSSNWESEPVDAADDEAAPGRIDWNVEVYDDDDRLSGIAQGIAEPWRVTEDTVPGREPVHVAPHKWTLSFNETREGGTYDVHPPARKRARERYKAGGAGNGKRVHINGKPIGKLDSEGRTWLTPEYARGDGHTTSGGFGTYYSRKGLIEETEATPQALRKGGTLYLTGETEDAVYLSTSRALPEGYEAVDPDDVAPGATVEPGREGATYLVLNIDTPSDGTPLECLRDERIIRHLGSSEPVWRHIVAERWTA